MLKLKSNENLFILFFLLLSIFLASMSSAINVTAFPALLIKQNISPFLIGLATAIELFGNIAISFLLSRLIFRLSISSAMIICASVYALNICLIYFYQNYFLWLFFCFSNGICWFVLFVIRQSWLSSLMKTKKRALILSLTIVIFCAGFICGSIIVKTFKALSYLSFLTSAALILSSILILLPFKNKQPKRIYSRRIAYKDLLKHNPICCFARYLLDFQGGCIISLTILFGVKNGFSVENSGFLLAAYTASGICNLYGGYFVNKYDRQKIISVSFLGTFLLSLASLFFYKSYLSMLLIYFCYGALISLILTTILTIVNESFYKPKLLAANAAFQSLGAIGFLSGSLIGGLLMQFLGRFGFFLALFFANLVYFIFVNFIKSNDAKNY